MLRIPNDSTNPHFNLALEEYLVTSQHYAAEDVVVVWQNEPTVVIGRNQNAELQVNRPYLEENAIHLARRMSGGGAVYHDSGNINFTVIKRDAERHLNDFSFFTQPVVECLASYGVHAEFAGRNDITVDGKKFSGNAQYRHGSTLLHHGTVLFDSDLSVLAQALIPKKRVEVPGVQSVAARVTNLRPYLSVDIHEFMASLAEALASFGGSAPTVRELSPVDLAAIETLATAKYATPRWQWGESPAYNWIAEARLSAGNVIACARVEQNAVVDFALFGDFFEVNPILELQERFVGIDVVGIADFAATLPVESYIHGATAEQFAALLRLGESV